MARSARSALGRMLQRMVGAHEVARHDDVPVDAVLDRARRHAHSRRAFLQSAGLAGTAMLTGCTGNKGQTPIDSDLRIGIIGGGIAGLTAAYRLTDLGYAPVVYEANAAHVGGRCSTDTTTFGQPAEHGGEFINTNHLAMCGLVEEMGLEVEMVFGGALDNGGSGLHLIDGEPYTADQATADWGAGVWKTFREECMRAPWVPTYADHTPGHAELDRVTVPEWLDRPLRLIIPTPRMHWVHHSQVRIETDSNYGTVLSIWDRIFRTFRLRDDPTTLQLGLDYTGEHESRNLTGMLAQPFRKIPPPVSDEPDNQ